MCTFVHNSMHIQHTEQRLYHAIYGGHDRTQWFRSSPWMVSSWGLHTGHSKIEVVWQCYQSPKFVSVFVWRNSVGGDSQFWWGIEFSANKLAGFDSRLVPIVKKLVKTLMCTFVHNKLLCTYVHIKPKKHTSQHGCPTSLPPLHQINTDQTNAPNLSFRP